MFKRVLLCYDGSVAGRRALRRGADEITDPGGGIRLPLPDSQDEVRALAITLNAMLDCLVHQHPGSTHEILCHPGYNDAALDAQETRLRASREIEYAALLEVIPEYSRNSDRLELIHYGNLGVAGLQRASNQYVPATGYEHVL